MKSYFPRILSFVAAAFLVAGLCRPAAVAASAGSGFRFQFGLAYVNGTREIADQLEKSLGAKTSFVWPIGLLIRPEWELGNNFAFGLALGPATIITIERRYAGLGGYSDKEYNFNIPLGADLRYSFGGTGNVAPYVRAGVRHNLVGGDSFDSGSAGVSGAAGLHFRGASGFGWALEAGYDSSTAKVGTAKVKPTGFTLSLLTAF